MTWDKLIQRALVPFEGKAGQLDKRAGLYMDEAQEDFALYTKCFVKKTHIYIVAEKTYVDLPKDFVELSDQPIFRGKCLTKARSNSSDYSLDVTTNQYHKGAVCDYYIENNRFYFLPRPTQSGTLTLSYIAVPNSLRTISDLKQLRFDNIVSEFFDVGDIIKSRVGGTGNTSSVATIERVEYEDTLSGIVTLSTITNGFTNDNEDFFVSGAESAQYESTYGTNWNSFITTWNNLGFGGMAKSQGAQFTFTDSSPQIPEVYHYQLVDYVKAMINQDLGNLQEFQNHFTLYLSSKEKARTIIANADNDKMTVVADAMATGYL